TAADAMQITTTAGGLDISVTGDAAGEDLDITTVGTATEMRLTSASTQTDAILIDSSAEASGVRIIAGDNEPTAQANGNDIELLAEDDVLITVKDSISFSGDTNGTFVVFSDAALNAAVADFDGFIELNLSASSSNEAVCANPDAPARTTNVVLTDCDSAPEADYAERYPTQAGVTYGEIVVPGSTMVRTYDAENGEQFIAQAVRSSAPYQGPIYGIVSNNYGDFTSAGKNVDAADHPMPVALVGRVPVKVVQEGGSIAVGDFLTTSSTPGAAMKATQAGRVIGMALSNWDGSSPTVMVQVINTWYQPAESASSSLQGGSSSALSVTDSISVADGSFSGSVTIGEHLYGSQDMAGRVRLASGKSSVRVTFETPYDYLPIVTFSSRSNSDSAGGAWISDEDLTGFTINRPNADAQVEFNWIAVGVQDAQVTVSDDFSEGTAISVTDTNGPSAPAPVPAPEAPAPEAPAPVPAPEAPAPEPAP
ncbi:hypothetical protein HZA87_03990, partial [Candidatus Uhrbacteria bacterium]|nr:hypothetical protein [Candidatus Uhrbacteria bacterium]